MKETSYLADILILLAAAIVAVPVFKRLGLGAVLGYLAAGAIVGPWGAVLSTRSRKSGISLSLALSSCYS